VLRCGRSSRRASGRGAAFVGPWIARVLRKAERGTEAPRPFLVDETIFPSRDTFWKQYRV
jgi:hypothetical protein